MPSIQRGSRFDGGTPPLLGETEGEVQRLRARMDAARQRCAPGLIAGDRRQRRSNFCGEKTIIGFEGEGLPLDFCCIRQAENRDCREDMLLPAVNSLWLACAAYTRMRDDDVERRKGN